MRGHTSHVLVTRLTLAEKASIDEAFLDLSPMVIDRILERHPHLKELPDDAPDGLDSPLPPAPPIDWTKAGNVFPIGGEGSADEDEAKSDGGSAAGGADGSTEHQDADGWEDWALCMGAEIMAELRNEVWKRLHYTCSAGIAHNKAMAKVGTLLEPWSRPLLTCSSARHGRSPTIRRYYGRPLSPLSCETCPLQMCVKEVLVHF